MNSSDLNLKEKFILLRAQGASFDRIAKDLGKAKQTLVNWARELEDEIANAKAIELEALAEQFFLTKQKKIESLGRVLTGIKDEIEKRDLGEVPTDKLLDLFMKYHALLQAEYIEPKFKSQDEIADAKSEREFLEGLVSGRPRIRKPESA